MQYILSNNFEKQFKRLPRKTKNKVIGRLNIFITDPMDYRLNNHPLIGEWAGHRSIDITGDIRAIYKRISEDISRFTAIGSHSELYE
ncbi:MAG: type II toxin-antitoxin system mRNA interferase toxin, RelE/StbE family [Patescibacteria group bacterium]